MNIYKKAFDMWGLKSQLVKLAEECSELSAGVCKYVIKDNDKVFANVIEEIADVEIMIEQVKYSMESKYPHMRNSIDLVKKVKLGRIAERLDNEEKNYKKEDFQEKACREEDWKEDSKAEKEKIAKEVWKFARHF